MDIINLGATDGLPAVDWANVVETLDAGSPPAPDAHNARTTWLSTVNQDGSPHVTAVGALWLDGSFWFQTGSGTRKCRNVARDPRCSIAVSIRDADVVAEGEASAGDRPGHTGAPCQGLGGPRVARRAGWNSDRNHRPLQRTVAGTTAVGRLPHQAEFDDRDTGHRAGWAHSLQVLTSARRPCEASPIDQMAWSSSHSNLSTRTVAGSVGANANA